MESRRANKNYSGCKPEPSGPVQQCEWFCTEAPHPAVLHPLQEPWLLSPVLKGLSSQQRHRGERDLQPQVLSRWKLLNLSVIGSHRSA